MQFMQSTKKKPTTSTQQQKLSLDFLVLIIPMTYHAIFCWTSKAQNYLQWKPWERYEKPLDSVNPREHVLFPTNKTFHNFWHLSTLDGSKSTTGGRKRSQTSLWLTWQTFLILKTFSQKCCSTFQKYSTIPGTWQKLLKSLKGGNSHMFLYVGQKKVPHKIPLSNVQQQLHKPLITTSYKSFTCKAN